MENQSNQSQTPNKTNPITWVVIIIVVIALGVGAYFLFFQGKGTNNNNTNTIVNTNSAVNVNTFINTNSTANGNANTNTIANLNTNANTNTNVDTSGWKTYANSEFGFEVKHPKDWQTAVSKTQYGDTIGTTVSFKIPKTQESPTDSNIQVFLNISVFDKVNQENIDGAFNRIFKVDLSKSKVSDYTVNGKTAKYYSINRKIFS